MTTELKEKEAPRCNLCRRPKHELKPGIWVCTGCDNIAGEVNG